MTPLAATLLAATLAAPLAVAPAMGQQMSPPPHPLGTMQVPPGQAPAAAPAYPAQPAPRFAPAPRYAPTPTPAAVPQAAPAGSMGTEPSSTKAGNIDPADTTTPYANRLPTPDLGENAAPRAFIEAARNALAAGRTGEAQEAMERAETRLLIRSVKPSLANTPNHEPVIQQLGEARRALGQGDRAGAMAKLEAALRNPELAQPTR